MHVVILQWVHVLWLLTTEQDSFLDIRYVTNVHIYGSGCTGS